MAIESEIRPETSGSRAEKIFLLVFVLLVAGSIGMTYWKIMVKRDYVIVAQADCDPYEEECFVHICDPSPEADGEWCTGDPEEDTWYTKNISRMAYNIPDCDPNDEDCAALVCEEGEENCSYELCDGSNVPEGDACNDPVRYAIDNPAEEEEAECDPEADEECVIDEEAVCDPETDEECVLEEEDACDPETDGDCVEEEADCDPAAEDCDAGEAPVTEDGLPVPDDAENTDMTCLTGTDGACLLEENPVM